MAFDDNETSQCEYRMLYPAGLNVLIIPKRVCKTVSKPIYQEFVSSNARRRSRWYVLVRHVLDTVLLIPCYSTLRH